jgi:hypothetical protein
MQGNDSLGSAGLVLLAMALTPISLLFLPPVVVVGVLALLALLLGLCSLGTASGKLAALGGGLLLLGVVLLTPRSPTPGRLESPPPTVTQAP